MSGSKSFWRYAAALVSVGVTLVAAGVVLSLSSTSTGVPDYASNQILVPSIDIASATVLEKLFVYADFKNPAEYSLTIFPGGAGERAFTADPSPLVMGKSIDIAIRIESRDTYHIQLGPGLRRVSLKSEVGGRDYYSSQPADSAGDNRGQVYLLGRITRAQPFLTLRIALKTSEFVRSGPYVRVVLPSIDSSAGVEETLEGKLEDLAAQARIATIDKVDYSQSELAIRAITSPFEQFRSELYILSMQPTPKTTPPLAWEERQRFIPSIVYKDAGWERSAQRKNLLGGVGIGLGIAMLTIPLGLARATLRTA